MEENKQVIDLLNVANMAEPITNYNQNLDMPANLDLQVTPEQVMEVVNGIVDAVGNRKLSQALLIRITYICMKITANMKLNGKNLSGNVKKKIVIAALEQYIKTKSGLKPDEMDLLMIFIDGVVSDLIDTLVDVTKSKTNFNNKSSKCTIM